MGKVEIQAPSAGWGHYIDDLIFTPGSVEANLSAITLSGGNVVLQGINGRAGQTYYVLMSTNLNLPLSKWTPVVTNMLSASGNFTFTAGTGTPTATQRFYILEMQ